MKVSPKRTTMFTRTETKLFPGVRLVHRFEERRAGIFGDRIATRESKHLEIGNRKIKLPVLLKH